MFHQNDCENGWNQEEPDPPPPNFGRPIARFRSAESYRNSENRTCHIIDYIKSEGTDIINCANNPRILPKALAPWC